MFVFGNIMVFSLNDQPPPPLIFRVHHSGIEEARLCIVINQIKQKDMVKKPRKKK